MKRLEVGQRRKTLCQKKVPIFSDLIHFVKVEVKLLQVHQILKKQTESFNHVVIHIIHFAEVKLQFPQVHGTDSFEKSQESASSETFTASEIKRELLETFRQSFSKFLKKLVVECN